MSGYWLPRYLSLKTFTAKIVGLTSALAGGYVIGKEGPLVHLSSILSVLLMKLAPFSGFLDTDHTRKRSILAAACAVGVVGCFGTPIGGVLFSVEVTSVYYMVGNLWKGFFGAVAALVCFQLMADFEIFEVPETKFVWVPHVGWEYYFFVAVGVVQGLFSALIVRMMAATSRWLRRRQILKRRRFVTGLSVCFVCATLRFVFPPMGVTKHTLLNDLFTHRPLHVHGNWHFWAYQGADGPRPACGPAGTLWDGYPACGPADGYPDPSDDPSDPSDPSDRGSLLVLLTFTVAELLLLISSIVLPIPNGCFFPIFVIGAASGRLYAEIAQLVFGIDGDMLPPAVISVVGAAALAAGTTQTLSTALICLEFTRQQQLLIPVLLAVVASCAVSGMLSFSIYDQILVLKDFPYMPHLRTERLHVQKAEDIMRPTVDVIDTARQALAQQGEGGASGPLAAGDDSPLRDSAGSRRHSAYLAGDVNSGGQSVRRSVYSLPATNRFHPSRTPDGVPSASPSDGRRHAQKPPLAVRTADIQPCLQPQP